MAAMMMLKLKMHWTTGQTTLQRLNTEFLRNTDKLNEIKVTLNNRPQALQGLLAEEETTMAEKWEWIKEPLTST
ncbi:unnamed protein product [Schistosoma curassoni]|uniref:DHC_N2 domain-containing protein n=1 Tax=Schistosoma curassoni TaxID=6186 RepID=A0A183KWG5_9TREM|nr:unnamed protein product [Schistosoma curassoni]